MAVNKAIRANSRTAWHQYYVAQYNRHGREDCAVLAMWYLLLNLAFEQDE